MCAQDESNKVFILKISLYLISLWILLFMLIVLEADTSKLVYPMSKKMWRELVSDNVVSVVCIMLILLGIVGYVLFIDTLNNAKNLPVSIQEYESINYENLSFLATYIIPLVCFPLETRREIFVLFAVIVVIGCIFVKTNLYYTNPSLVLMGFNVYRVICKDNGAFGSGIVIIRGKLNKGDKIKYLELSDNVYFGRRVKSGN